MICPRCGSFIDPGDAYCPGCGATFQSVEDEDDDYLRDYVLGLKAKINRLIINEEYEKALHAIKELDGYEDASDELRIVRKYYVDCYVQYMDDFKNGDAYDVIDQYLEIFPEDTIFLSIIAVKAREFRDLMLVDEMYNKMDMLDGFSQDFD